MFEQIFTNCVFSFGHSVTHLAFLLESYTNHTQVLHLWVWVCVSYFLFEQIFHKLGFFIWTFSHILLPIHANSKITSFFLNFMCVCSCCRFWQVSSGQSRLFILKYFICDCEYTCHFFVRTNFSQIVFFFPFGHSVTHLAFVLEFYTNHTLVLHLCVCHFFCSNKFFTNGVFSFGHPVTSFFILESHCSISNS